MKRGRRLVTAVFAATTAVGVAIVSGATAAPATPRLVAPGSGAVVAALPAFAWSPMRGANHYEFQIAADANFSSPVLGRGRDQFVTYNTRAALLRMIPNGTYWWRVRAVSKGGDVSSWSPARQIKKAWKATPKIVWPANGARVNFPTTPLTLRWTATPGAAKYRVAIATDEALSSLVSGKPIETAATNLTPAFLPGAGTAPKTYYWTVTPVDAGGNAGVQATVARFDWGWPSATSVKLEDLRHEPETFDPQFSWNAVKGAASYEMDVNSSQDFAPGSRVCCKDAIIGTSWSPTVTLPDNTYYWRVRALDGAGNAGVWNSGPEQGRFEKVFDKAAILGGTSIRNLHLRDNTSDPASGPATSAPVVVWDAVPGASSYFVEMVPFAPAGFCDWNEASIANHWRTVTAVNAWTPLGSRLRATQPYPDRMPPAVDSAMMVANRSYCVRVRAQSDRDTGGGQVYGDFTYLNGNDRPGFTFTGYCQSSCARGYLDASDYLLPQGRKTTTPYFTWRGSKGASWFVIVAKDREFHTIVDYAFTQIPAYAPRTVNKPATYPDETTAYYWAVLPAAELSGNQAVGDPLAAAPASFNKQSTPPTLLAPTPKANVTGRPEFSWTPVEGALRYRLQVSRDDDFGQVIDDIVTDSVAYTSKTSYPADVALYWRVRSEDANTVGLTWSETRIFRYHLGTPTVGGNAVKGDMIPTWNWASLTGAISYDLHAELPDGTSRDFARIPSAAWTPTKMTGTGIFAWKVRANFSKGRSGTVPGPYSQLMKFTRTISAPAGAKTLLSARGVVLSWQPKLGAKSYKVDVAAHPDFSRMLETTRTDAAVFAPLLRSREYLSAKKLFWRVAAIDEDGNQGNYSKTVPFRVRGATERRGT